MHGNLEAWLNIPGWRIEQRYAPGVLIGNWAEERYTFKKDSYKHNTTHRIDFKNYGSHHPDVLIRRKRELLNEGLPKELIFHHHGNRYARNLVTWYDEDYNGRYKEKKLPELRTWTSRNVAWVPEKSDIHVQAPPTNFGLLGKLQKKWRDLAISEMQGDYKSVYTTSYQDFPPDAAVHTRYATPKMESSSIHPPNKVMRELQLRNKSALKLPEKMPPEIATDAVQSNHSA